MPHRHPRVTAALATAAVAAGVSLTPAPAVADPDLDDVQERVDTLYHEAEQAQERSHEATLELKELNQDLSSLKADERRQRRDVRAAREHVEDAIVRQYQGSTVSTVGQLVVSEDPRAFLDRLATMSSYRQLQTERFDSYDTQLDALTLRREATADRRQQVKKLKQKREQEQERVQEKLAEAEDLLAELEAEERARLREQRQQERQEQEAQAREAAEQTAPAEESSDAGAAATASAPVSGGAGAAVQKALAQVGDAYVYGATGPDAFDCSGLTMTAWAAAGVSLPHSSGAQMGSGPSVSAGNLKPGDLVFYYSPVSHVGIYIGNGQIVHAANPGTGVAITGVHSMPFSGAVRPG